MSPAHRPLAGDVLAFDLGEEMQLEAHGFCSRLPLRERMPNLSDVRARIRFCGAVYV